MTWKDIKKATLQRLFVIEGGTVVISHTTEPYLNAMPAAANEGIFLLASVGGTGTKSVTFNKTRHTGSYQAFNMNDLVKDFSSFTDEIYIETSNGRKRVFEYLTESSSVLLLPSSLQGEVTVYYNPVPALVTELTPDDEELQLLPMASNLLPLYMASQLFKDDDMQQAVQLRNEFEAGLSRLSRMVISSRKKKEKMENITGWR